ncbi:alpha-amylase [Algibacter lectus]|uniref:Alpha-amylase n=1 Tax=Algibacter lectus TaxID=221126 RepID=A0A090X4Y5_9FLAO|nr:alpha-amylase [Algibacter lectus]
MQNQKRVVIDYVSPTVNGGDFYIKRVVNEIVNVDAHIMADGHDVLGATILYKHENDKTWQENRMVLTSNDEWKASFSVQKQGFYNYKVEAWVDYALNWRYGLIRKINDGQHVVSELLEGAEYIEPLLNKVNADDKQYLEHLQRIFKDENSYGEAISEAVKERLYNIFFQNPIKILANTSSTYKVYVDRKKARFSTWYEFFPRSARSTKAFTALLTIAHAYYQE